MCMVRSPKSIGGIFGLALGNAPYGDCDRTDPPSLTLDDVRSLAYGRVQ
jgi:hypothetical protein